MTDLQYLSGFEDCFQMAKVVYKIDLDDWMTLLATDRDGLIAASSATSCLRYTRAALDMFVGTANRLREEETNGRSTVSSANIAARRIEISWTCSEKTPGKTRGTKPETISPNASASTHSSIPENKALQRAAVGQIKISTMQEAISAVVPMSLMDPGALARVATLLYIVNLYDDQSQHDQSANSTYSATVHITTDQYNVRFPQGLDDETNRVPTMPLWSASPVPPVPQKKIRRTALTLPNFRDDPLRDSENQSHKSYEKMERWTFDQSSISVPCPLYVWTVLAVGFLLVTGGVVVGLTVHTRISGVDPFNITLFFWILAGFLLAGFKSLRVEDWPWRDFILGRVVCRSVSELNAVTGIDEQLILRKLLQCEKTSILNTKGPFNGAFARTSPDSFSIDRPLTLRSMMLSGLIMVKVKTPQGFALICLNVKKDTLMASLSTQTSQDKIERLVCLDISPMAKGSFGEFKLTRDKMGWIKIADLYSVLESKFG